MKQLEIALRVPRAIDRKINFNDIEHAIVKFAGDDRTQDVNIFFTDFEQIMIDVQADESFKLLCLRRSLAEGIAAQCLLRTPDASNYSTLKLALNREFGTAVTRQDVYRMLRQRVWKKEQNRCITMF